MNVITLIAAVAVLQSPRAYDEYMARREYSSAVSWCRSELTQSPGRADAMRDLARALDCCRRYDSSSAWWNEALRLAPEVESAQVGLWRSAYRRDEDDVAALAATTARIREDALALLPSASAHALTLAYDGLSICDPTAADVVAARLMRSYPASQRGHDLIGASFYDSLYPVWSDDSLKIPVVRRFIDRFPQTEWRQTFYFFLLSARFGRLDTIGLLTDADEMVADDSLDPFRWRFAASLLNRLRLHSPLAEHYARQSVKLAPMAQRPPHKPAAQWVLDSAPLLGQARLALAEALVLQGRPEEARPQLESALAEFRWDANSEWTPAPFHVLLAEIAVGQRDTAAALACYSAALEAGDSRGTWSARADSGVVALGQSAAALRVAETSACTFTDVTSDYGLSGLHESRVAWGDYNNDGWQDMLLNGSRLLRNDSGRRFIDVSGEVGLAGASGRGGVWADFDNDGWLDIYAPGADTSDHLLRNDSGRFADVTSQAGYPSDPHPTEGCAWADFDNDGWIDLYCANYEDWESHCYFPDRLYQNRQGTFVDVTGQLRAIPAFGESLAGRGVNWGDLDSDGWPECYVSNYRLCRNLCWSAEGDSGFVDVAARLGIGGDDVDGWFGHTIGSSWADYDNDGDLDLFVANLAHPRYIEFSNRSQLYENLGPSATPRFVDRRASAGIRYEETHTDPAWADVDNDGDLDLYITSVYEGRRSFLYENRGPKSDGHGMRFADITWRSGTRTHNGWGCAFADLDNDGDQDLVVGSGSGVRLFRNDTRNRNHWLEVKLHGTRVNRAGIGCRVIVRQGRACWMREVEGGKGTTSQNSLVQHFGLGPSDVPVNVEVRFGPGRSVVFSNVRPDGLLEVVEP
jgi:tetratricopeptide (TPR) repeat protein